MEDTFTKELKENEERYHHELEEKKNQYSQKMLEDAARYQTLLDQHNDEQRKFISIKQAIFE